MRAATIRNGEIVVAEHPDPEPDVGEVQVRVRAAGLNGADQMQLRGLYPPPPGSRVPVDIPGLEFAGHVEAIMSGSGRIAVGDKVMALTDGGAQAELAVVPEGHLIHIPDGLDWPQAGGFSEVFCTAYDALFNTGRLQRDEHLLVHGAAGGVGTAAIQLAKYRGAKVTATVRNPAYRDAVAALGAVVIAPEDFAPGGSFDVILELVGGPNMATNVASLATGGRIVVIGIAGGYSTELNLGELMFRRGTIASTTLRSRSPEAKAALARQIERDVLPAVAAGQVHVPLAAAYPLDQVSDAYTHFAEGGKLGKLVLTL
jgi:NADPH2:quinone reductase